MKNLFFLLSFIILLNKSYCQNLIAYDYMETWNWPGLWWGNTLNSTWATNFSVSPNESAVIYGAGNGTSAIEQDWYILPNISGLDPNSQYEFRFRLASYRVTSTNNTRGVDVADFVEVQVSYDGELSYTSELRITGNGNAFWDYNTNGTITHVANGSFTNSLAPVGDVYQSGAGNQQFTGPSVITLILPPGITQVAVDILCRINSAGEEWWFDNIELWEIPSNPLPVTLTSFTANCNGEKVNINWTTASEYNSDYFQIEKSRDGVSWVEVGQIKSVGSSNTEVSYSFHDIMINNNFEGYYRLKQVDIDGMFEYFTPKYITCNEYEKLFYTNVYPNPTESEINLIIINNSNEEIKIEIYDITGKLIQQKNIVLDKEYYLETIYLNNNISGMYILTISTIQENITHKIIKK
jgi:hypothetical protein